MTNSSVLPLVIGSVLTNCSNGIKVNKEKSGNASITNDDDSYNDKGAVIYIVAVLMFYSIGIVVMIIQYLRTEKKELEEQVDLESFFKLMPDRRAVEEKRVNTVAIRAFHTLTSFSYNDDVDIDYESPILEHPPDLSAKTLLITDV